MKNIHRSLVIGCSLLALSACGPDEIVSPGTSGDIIINNPAPTPTPTPTGGTGNVTPANGCPTISDPQGLTNGGTIEGPTGEWRICELPAKLNVSSTLPKVAGVLYALTGRTDVGTDGGAVASGSDTNVTLTIDPGVIVYAETPRSYMVVNRGNKINAVGTSAQPIIFTSRDNVQGVAGDSSIGQWGGVVLLGRAPVSDCRDGTPNKPNQADCEQELEGAALTTLFGGNTAADNSGKMQYFQIRFSGFTLELGSELQSLTLGGVGSGTVIDHFQSFNSSDDGMEMFGGGMNMSEVIVVGADDDGLDVDTGAKLNMKNVIAAQRTNGGDNLIELDSPADDYTTSALPQTVLNVSSFTFIERSTANSQVVRARGGAKLNLANGIMDTDNETCIRIDEQVTMDANPTFNSVIGDCDAARAFDGVASDDSDLLAKWNAGSNNNAAATLTLTSLFVNGTNEDAVVAYNPASLSSFFTTPTKIGAAWTGNTSWYTGWTCNSATAGFGAGNTGLCTTLPIF